MKNMILLLGLLLCLCVNSWGECYSEFNSIKTTGQWCSGPSCVSNCSTSGRCCNLSCAGDYCSMPNVYKSGNSYLTDLDWDTPISAINASLSEFCNNKVNYHGNGFNVRYKVRCTTQAEADSAAISQKCATGTMVKDTVNSVVFDACKNGEGLLISFNDPLTGAHNSSIGYYIVTDSSADLLDEATYNHLASLACTEVSLYRGVLNGKYVYWYSTDPEPAGVVSIVRIK